MYFPDHIDVYTVRKTTVATVLGGIFSKKSYFWLLFAGGPPTLPVK